MKFSENLRRLRKERGYSQEELAEKLSVTRQAISKWENATAMPDLKKITETAQLFGVSMDELLGIEPDIKTATTETVYNNQVYNLKLLQQEKKTKTAAGNKSRQNLFTVSVYENLSTHNRNNRFLR